MAGGRRPEGFPSHIVYLGAKKKKKRKKRIYKVGTYDRRITLKKIGAEVKMKIKIPPKEKIIELTPKQKICMRKHLNDIVEYEGEQYKVVSIQHY